MLSGEFAPRPLGKSGVCKALRDFPGGGGGEAAAALPREKTRLDAPRGTSGLAVSCGLRWTQEEGSYLWSTLYMCSISSSTLLE